jgi:hypothetical protein
MCAAPEEVNMKRLLTRWLVPVVAAGAVGLLATGCAWSIGGQQDAKSFAQPTKGQELCDLKKAKDQGAITEQEYEAQKQKILSK